MESLCQELEYQPITHRSGLEESGSHSCSRGGERPQVGLQLFNYSVICLAQVCDISKGTPTSSVKKRHGASVQVSKKCFLGNIQKRSV